VGLADINEMDENKDEKLDLENIFAGENSAILK